MHHHVTLVSRRARRKLLSARASSRFSIFHLARDASPWCVGRVRIAWRKIDARQRDLEKHTEKESAREETVRSKYETTKVIARQPPFRD